MSQSPESSPAFSTDPDAAELVVLVDESGTPTGTTAKATVHTADTPLHLAFSAYLFSDDGELLLTRRAADKRVFPGLWTNSVCGHPAPGESLPDAASRRARVELGAQVRGLRLVLPAFAYRAEMDGIVENERCPVYIGWLDRGRPLVLDPSEVGEVEWVDWSTCARQVVAGERPVSPWCVEQVRQLVALGDDIAQWPPADADLLPPAAAIP